MSPPVAGWAAGEGPPEPRRPSEVIPARRLLRRLVAVVAEPTTPQQRLDKIVRMIAADLVAEVCSVYVQRAGDFLELFATEGLAREAVHRTRLRVGEGLVGTIAATGDLINTSDAQNHPNFAYRPETREEIYNSFLGVPILRSGRVVGVLTIQNTARRLYGEDEIDAMQIIASVLAEMFASGGLLDRERYADLGGFVPERRRLEALRLVEGVAIGRAWLHEPRIEITRLLADDPAAERVRLEEAMVALRSSLDRMLARADLASGEHREVLEAYRMFADDTGWLRRIREAIDTGLSAEAAVRRVQEQTRVRIGHAADPVLKERLLDLDDLANRLLLHLAGRSTVHDPSSVPEDCILIARSLSAAELIEYDRAKLKGIILEEGSKTAHVTIVARALDVPLVGRVSGAMTLFEPGDPVALDAENGIVFLRPSEDVLQAFARTVQARNERRRQLAALKDAPAVTRDGVEIWVGINAAFLADLPALDETGAMGIGLFRTELGFMTRPSWPTVEEQSAFYRRILELAGDRRVVFRTLDIGSDKHLPYWRAPAEDNPALGWRAIRVGLDRPALLRGQLRALLTAASGRSLALMFPMVAEVAEFEAARRLLEQERDRLAASGVAPPARLEVGVMFEVPALYWQLEALLPKVDFVSIGSNDLLQFLFACDRGNPALAERYDVLAPAALAFLRDLVERCRARGVPLTLCGEMASRPLEAMALVGIGIRRLSLAPSEIGSVKAMIRSLEASRLADYLAPLLALPDRSLRRRLAAWALDHGVVLPPGQSIPT
ncbi:MAG: phosphoenolpyruvate--protein phosphotransferase [Geminicoccaceae bacterium]|nr:phosphoenolpyruvate--protein phosphotransferase [Geminicoccaceae bacterium]MCX8101470.1 phosphoenolpyruvate--protein phosphotransferase [Geminicoccaceae bacterium]MDW8369203.1 phosphoenolpyruvate--protein phosphotransferase [Geminicoccaceae bacterium]